MDQPNVIMQSTIVKVEEVEEPQPVSTLQLKQEEKEEEKNIPESEVEEYESVSAVQFKKEEEGEDDVQESEEEIPLPYAIFFPTNLNFEDDVKEEVKDHSNHLEENYVEMDNKMESERTAVKAVRKLKKRRSRKVSIGRLSTQARHARMRRRNQSVEEREAIRARARMYVAMKRASESPEEREKRLYLNKMSRRIYYKNQKLKLQPKGQKQKKNRKGTLVLESKVGITAISELQIIDFSSVEKDYFLNIESHTC